MHRSGTTPRHRWLGIALCAVLLSSTFGLPGGGRAALADDIADKRAEAGKVAEELEAQGERVSILAERLNQAQLQADKLAGQVRVAEAELAAADREVAAVRSRLRQRAVASYVGGGRTAGELPIQQLLDSGSANDLVVRRAYVSSIAGTERATADTLDAAQEQRRVRRADLDAAQQSAKGVLDDVAAQRKAAAAAAAERRATLDRVQGELGALVEAEQARRAAEEQKRVEAELAARQAREEAARAAAKAEQEREAATRRTTTTTTAARPPAVTIPLLGGDDEGGGPAPVDGPARPPAAGGAAAVAEARRQLGKPYEYGSPGPDSFDCSGLTSWAWRAAGRSLPHSSAAQYGATIRVPVSEIEVGDLVFYGKPIHHVGIYAGDGQMVEASETGTPVRMASIFRRDLVGVGRVG
ncbi:MAG: NlpC/P60 family protein [Acidimicrobiales bacterium]